MKCFFDMLLVQDVAKHEINDIKNFKLDKNRFCFMCPWKEQRVQHILDKKLKKLNPIATSHLTSFDNPVSAFIERKIIDFSGVVALIINKRVIYPENCVTWRSKTN